MVEDKTTDPNVSEEVRDYIMQVCERLNEEEAKKEKPFLFITEFEVKKDGEI